MRKCVKCEVIQVYHGFTINREEDQKIDIITEVPFGKKRVFYTVNDGENMLESFKTLKDAMKYVDEVLHYEQKQ